MMNIIEALNDKTNCCGCEACANICPVHCIVMKADKEGFLYPKIDLGKCIKCNLCNRICPTINNEKEKRFQQRAYIIQNRDEKILKESTSGGAFTAIAENIISKGGIVYGAVYNSNLDVIHVGIENSEKLHCFRNSKYVQSNIKTTFLDARKYLDCGRIVLFSGTPCQIEGLLYFLQRDYDNLFTVDLVCHAIPSPYIWNIYKNFREEQAGEILKNVTFRNKELYGYTYSQMCLEFLSGKKTYIGIESDPYLRAFFSNLSIRPSCYQCKFKKQFRKSDLTIWDCFDSHKIDKSFDNNKGVTHSLVHTKKGENLINEIGHVCKIVEMSPEIAISGVKELVQSVSYNKNRFSFFEDSISMECKEVFENWFPLTTKTKTELLIRRLCAKFEIYNFIKSVIKKWRS